MSFKIGGSASKTKEKTSSTLNSTTTPIVPEWISSLAQGSADKVGGLWNQDPASLVSPAHALQTSAAQTAATLSGSPWNFDAAADLTRGVANTSWLDPYMNTPSAAGQVVGASLLDNLHAYMSPYTQDVVDSALKDYDYGAGNTRAEQDLALARDGAFGGSGAAITRSMTEDALTRGRATTSANLRDQAFTRAATLAGEDADRRQQAQIQRANLGLQDAGQKVGWGLASGDQRLQAGNQLAQLSAAYDSNLRANLETQAGLGGTLRNIDQQQLQAPVTQAQQIVAMLNGLPLNLFVGEQKNQAEQGTKSGTEFKIYGEGSQT